MNVLSTTEPVHLNMINMANFMLSISPLKNKRKKEKAIKEGKEEKQNKSMFILSECEREQKTKKENSFFSFSGILLEDRKLTWTPTQTLPPLKLSFLIKD